MASAFAGHADAFAVLVQYDGNGHEHAAEKPKERARPADAEIDVHRPCEQRERGAKHGTNKVVSGEDARGVGGICVCEVIQDSVLWVMRAGTSDFDLRTKQKVKAVYSRKGAARRC